MASYLITADIRDLSEVYSMRARELEGSTEKQLLWDIAIEAYPPCQSGWGEVNSQMTIMGNRSTYSGVTSDSGVSPLRTRMMLP